MNSQELDNCQQTITALLIAEINEPMKNWALISKYTAVLKDIDTKRRKTWKDEKFGVYEQIAENLLTADFTKDDIPF